MKKLGRLYFILFLVLTGSILVTCVKDPYKDQLSQEKSQIEDYITKNSIKAIKRPSGLYFLSKDTAGDHPGVGDYVLITYKATFLDGTIYDTTDSTEAQNMKGFSPWFKPGGPMTFSMNSTIFPGLVEGLSLIHEGGNVTLIMPSSLAANSYTLAPRIYYVELLKVYHNIAVTQKQFFDSAMVKIGFVLKDSAGICIDTRNAIIDTAGKFFPGDTSKLARDTSTLAGKYITRYINRVAVKCVVSYIDTINNVTLVPGGRECIVIDSFKYNLDTIPLPIFNEAVLKMKNIKSANVYVPFYNAYGATPLLDSNTGQIIIPPYTNLKYDIEFLGFLNDKGIIDKNLK